MTEIQSRKQSHLDICLNQDVESGSTRLQEIHLVHKSCPELALSSISTSTSFLHYNVNAPIFISCMTGGTEQGAKINRVLARVAEELKIPVGLGSMRILFEQKNLIDDFSIKHLAPSVPVMANLGALQLKYIDNKNIVEMLKRLEVDALVLHLNAAQELSQKNSDTDFTEILSHIRHFVDYCKVPIIVKEVGFGIDPKLVQLLRGYGVRYIDLSGSGGTNWARVEHIHNMYAGSGNPESNNQTSSNHVNSKDIDTSLFYMSYPTGLLMLALYKQPNILASGGIRTALDLARCLVLGAKLVGIALPIIKRAVLGFEPLLEYLLDLIQKLKQIMLLCGADTLQKMPEVKFWLEANLQKDLENFCKAHGIQLSI